MLVSSKVKPFVSLMRLDKPIGALLLLWPTLWALWLAGMGHPSWSIVIIFAVGVLVMRSAGCVVNDIADRHFDGRVARTANRPLACGQLSVKAAVFVFVGLCLMAFVLWWFLNWPARVLAIPALLLAVIYPFMKRYTYWPQLVLGVAFSWSIPMVYAALDKPLVMSTWLLFVAAVLWTIVYDTQYAMCDREDDLKIGLKSTAILFGRWDRLVIGLLQVLVMSLLLWVSWLNHFAVGFYVGLLFALLLAIYQQRLIYQREPNQCFRAFLNNHWFGMVVFFGFLFSR